VHNGRFQGSHGLLMYNPIHFYSIPFQLFQPYITILVSNFTGKPTISLVTILHESIEKSTLKKTEGANGRSQVEPIFISGHT
jgi:hypothetical protein